MNGFGEQFKLVPAGARFLKNVHDTCLTREEQDASGRAVLADGKNGFDPVQFRHDDIYDYTVRTLRSHRIDGSIAVVKRDRIISVVAQNLGQTVCDIHLIVHNENTFAPASGFK